MLLARLLIVLIVAIPSMASAAVTCADPNAVAQEFAVPSDPMTTSYTPPSGSDAVGFVLAGHRGGAGALTVTAISWGASTPAPLTTVQYRDPIGGQLFQLTNPPSGAQTISVTWSGSHLADNIAVFVCRGAHQTTPTHDAAQATGDSTTAAVTVANVLSSDVVIACVTTDGTPALTGGGSLTLIATPSAPGESNNGCWSQPGSAGGSVSVTWTGTQEWTIQAVAVRPSSSTDAGGDVIWFP